MIQKQGLHYNGSPGCRVHPGAFRSRDNERRAFVLEVAALLNFISNLIGFRSFYADKFYTRKYNHVFYNYSAAPILVFGSFFALSPLFTQVSLNLNTFLGIFTIVSFIVAIVTYVALVKITGVAKFKIKMDWTNRILIALAILLLLAFGTNLLPGYGFILLPLAYVLGYAVLLRKKYVNG